MTDFRLITSTSNKVSYKIAVNANYADAGTWTKALDWKLTIAEGGLKIGTATSGLTDTLANVDGARTSPNGHPSGLPEGFETYDLRRW